MALVRVASLADLPPGSVAEADGILVCNHQGALRAYQALCPHRNGPLSQGNFMDGRIICPWHAWEFRCDTGELDYNSEIRLKSYDVVVRDGDVYVDA